jgi:hypothetical protein
MVVDPTINEWFLGTKVLIDFVLWLSFLFYAVPVTVDEVISNAVKNVTSDDEDSDDDSTEEGSADKLLVF